LSCNHFLYRSIAIAKNHETYQMYEKLATFAKFKHFKHLVNMLTCLTLCENNNIYLAICASFCTSFF
jgi:hypothetical protein